MNHNFIDLTGRRFGRLVALRYEAKSGAKSSRARLFWICRCDCGTEKHIASELLRRGDTSSCGCLQRESAQRRATRHGMKGTKLYRAWCAINCRCYNSKTDQYHNYGGRGIDVCAAWRDSFEVFATHIGEPPSPNHSIDRIDNARGYEPGNVRWATARQQGRNRRGLIFVNYNGASICLAEAVEQTRLSYATVYSRIFKYGWTPERALGAPLRV